MINGWRTIRRGLAGMGVLAAGLAAGCAARAPAPPREGLIPRAGEALIITRAGGEATLTWQTRPGVVYELMVKDQPGPDHPWRPLPGFGRVRGDGQQHAVTVPSLPGDTRRFNVRPYAEGAGGAPPGRSPAIRSPRGTP